jgi:mitochondrial chaperone BCS1
MIVRGIPHTMGVVMYGVPGCGKTSTIKAIANVTKRHIFNIMLSEIKTKEALKDLFYNDQVFVYHDNKREVLNIPLKNRLYVIEDIDAMDSVVIKRSAKDSLSDEQRKIKVDAEMELLKQTQGEAMAKAMIQGKQTDENDKLDLATLLNVLDGVRETPGRIIILSTNYP